MVLLQRSTGLADLVAGFTSPALRPFVGGVMSALVGRVLPGLVSAAMHPTCHVALSPIRHVATVLCWQAVVLRYGERGFDLVPGSVEVHSSLDVAAALL